MKHSWKTTVGGVMAAVGAVLIPWGSPWREIGEVLAAAGASLVGITARDDDVSSEGFVAPKKKG